MLSAPVPTMQAAGPATRGGILGAPPMGFPPGMAPRTPGVPALSNSPLQQQAAQAKLMMMVKALMSKGGGMS